MGPTGQVGDPGERVRDGLVLSLLGLSMCLPLCGRRPRTCGWRPARQLPSAHRPALSPLTPAPCWVCVGVWGTALPRGPERGAGGVCQAPTEAGELSSQRALWAAVAEQGQQGCPRHAGLRSALTLLGVGASWASISPPSIFCVGNQAAEPEGLLWVTGSHPGVPPGHGDPSQVPGQRDSPWTLPAPRV